MIYVLLQVFPPARTDYSERDKTFVEIGGRVSAREYRLQSSSYGAASAASGQIIMILTVRTSDACVLCRMSSAGNGDENLGGSGASGEDASVASLYDAPPIGSQVRVHGKLHSYPSATNPGEFDQALYYQTLGFDYAIYDGVIDSVQGEGQLLEEGLCRVREFLSGVLDSCCGMEDASILKAMLLGEKGYLSNEIRSLYQNSGIIHILAISGLHISMIGMGLYHLLKKVHAPVPVCTILPVAVMLVYGRMTGMSASSFRAVFMFVCHMAAILLLRTYDLLTALCVAGVLLLVQQPLYLYHSGFLFSFGAVLGIGLLMPALPGRWMKALAVPLVTLPVYLQFYGTFPVYSLFLNLLVLPLMSAVMAAGLALLAAGSICLPVGTLLGLPTHLILTFYKAICLGTEQLPGNTVVAGRSESWQVVLYYVLLLAAAYGAEQFPSACRCLICAVALPVLLMRISPGLEIDMISVGQGEGIYLSYETAGIANPMIPTGLFRGGNGTRILIDGGSTSMSNLYQYQLLPFLKSKGAAVIDLAIVTHGDEDHTNGLIGLLEDEKCPVQVRRILLPSSEDPDQAGAYIREIVQLADQKDIPVSYLSEGDEISLRSGMLQNRFRNRNGVGVPSSGNNGVQILCLHPEQNADYADANEYSCTLYLQYRNFTALLTGDLEGDGENRCLQYMKSRPDVFPYAADGDPGTCEQITLLQVAHHGSSGATSDAFLEAVHPAIAAISCGWNNRYGHPHAATLQRLTRAGARILDTRYTGEMEFRTDGKKVKVLPYGNFHSE